MRLWLLFILALSSVAAGEISVEQLQANAYLLRNGQETPLAVDSKLQNGDEIRTDAGARAYLKLPDNARIKLGENARLKIEMQQDRPEAYRGVFSVLQGAFRYTAESIRRIRDVKIQLSTATIGIRGTDLWGKQDGDNAFVVLIEGNIMVQDGDAHIAMEKSQRVYDITHKQFSIVPTEALLKYAAETEIAQ